MNDNAFIVALILIACLFGWWGPGVHISCAGNEFDSRGMDGGAP